MTNQKCENTTTQSFKIYTLDPPLFWPLNFRKYTLIRIKKKYEIFN